LQSGETIAGIDIRAGGATPGTLYAVGSGGHVYSIDTTTGVATAISTLSADPADTSDPFSALSGTHFGVDFDPVFDRLRVVSDTGQNLSINVDTGATITDAALTVAGSARSGVNGAAGGGVLRSVGPLGVDADAVGDFEIATAADGTNNGYAVLVVGGVPTS